MDRIKEDFEEFCEKKKEELGKLSPALEMSKPDVGHPVHYQRKGRASDDHSIYGPIINESPERRNPIPATLPLPRQQEGSLELWDESDIDTGRQT